MKTLERIDWSREVYQEDIMLALFLSWLLGEKKVLTIDKPLN